MPLNAETTVLLLGTDTPIGLAVVRDLGRHGYRVIGIGRTARTVGGASRYCSHHFLRAGDEERLIDQITTLARRYHAAFLLAISESDLLTINRHREQLETAVRPLVPTAETLAFVLDKAICCRHAEQVGIRTPRTRVLDSVVDAIEAARQFGYPVVLKWADPNAVATKLTAAQLPLHKAQFARDADELSLCLAPYAAIGSLPLVQEYCPGRGIGHMFLTVDGKPLVEFQHQRVHEWPPEGGVSSLCRSLPLSEHRAAREGSRRLLESLRWTGVAMVEYRYDDATDTWYFMEVNGRFWGSLPLAVAAGVPFASGLVAVCGEHRSVPPFRRDYPSLACLFWIPETRRLLRVLFRPRAIADPAFKIVRWRELLDYAAAILDPRSRNYVFSWGDPAPFFVDAWAILLKAIRSLLHASFARARPASSTNRVTARPMRSKHLTK